MHFFFIRSWEFKTKYIACCFLSWSEMWIIFKRFLTVLFWQYTVVYIFTSLSIHLSRCPSVFLYDDPQETIVAFQYIHTWYARQTVDSVNFTRKIAFQQHSNKLYLFKTYKYLSSYNIPTLFILLLAFFHIKGILEMVKAQVNSSLLK